VTRIPFTKMHGAGNDFIMLDARDLPDALELDRPRIAAWCDRRKGVGADGLIVVGSEGPDTVRMTYFNADGGEAEMCGNGARCTVSFAHDRGLVGDRCCLATASGLLEGVVHAHQDIEVSLPAYRDLVMNLTLDGAPDSDLHACNTGVPHLVILVTDLEAVDVDRDGRALREHPRFAPAGTNVNWVAPAPAGDRWLLRTYERGVEAETLACGTGASAAAVVLTRLGRTPSPVAIQTRGGDLLTITVDHDTANLHLRGPAVVAFAGEVCCDE
jgi:diaminopimelate epimerase